MDKKYIAIGEALVEAGRIQTAAKLATGSDLTSSAVAEVMQARVVLAQYVEEHTSIVGRPEIVAPNQPLAELETATYIAACIGMGAVSILAAQGKLPQ